MRYWETPVPNNRLHQPIAVVGAGGGRGGPPPPPPPPRPEADRSRSLVKRGVSPKNELYQQGHKGHEHAISLQ